MREIINLAKKELVEERNQRGSRRRKERSSSSDDDSTSAPSPSPTGPRLARDTPIANEHLWPATQSPLASQVRSRDASPVLVDNGTNASSAGEGDQIDNLQRGKDLEDTTSVRTVEEPGPYMPTALFGPPKLQPRPRRKIYPKETEHVYHDYDGKRIEEFERPRHDESDSSEVSDSYTS